MKARLREWAPMLTSVVLMILAFPPFNIFLLVFVALVPWLAKIRVSDAKYARRSGYWFGFLYFAFQMFWVVMFVDRWTSKLLLSLVPWVVCMFLAGWFYCLAAWLMHVCFRRSMDWVVPIVWAGIEGFRAYIPGLAFPWGNISLPLWVVPGLVQHAAYGTMFLVSAWLVVANLAVAEVVSRRTVSETNPRRVFHYAWAFVGLMMLGGVRMLTVPPATKTWKVTLGQPGVDMAFTEPMEERRLLNYAASDLLVSAVADKSDLLVLPEGFGGAIDVPPPVTSLGPQPPVPVALGVHRRDGEDTFQTALFWDGSVWHIADKTRLVVFGEYVPLRDQLPILQSFSLPSGDLKAAKRLSTPLVNGVRIGPLVCFEGVFPDLGERHARNGANLLVQMSIDDWYIGTPAWDQLWMSSVWRSIESGMPLVRVGGLGRSLATDSRGRIITMLPASQTLAKTVQVPIAQADGFNYRFVFVWVSWATCFLVGLAGLTDAFRRPQKQQGLSASDGLVE